MPAVSLVLDLKAGSLSYCDWRRSCRPPRHNPAARGLSGPPGGHHLGEPDDIQHPAEIVGERGQTELGADLLQATHQKRALVHPLLDRAERMFDGLATTI